MKKVISIILFIIMSVALVACNNDKNHVEVDHETMVIQKSEFSQETQEVLKIMENEITFFDYEVDETIKSMSIDIWTYKDGKWINPGKTDGNVDGDKKKIAIRQNQNAYDIFTIDQAGYTKYTFDNIVDFSECTMQTYFRMPHPTSIKADEEITLWVNLGTTKDALTSGENFREADCNTGAAVTITFSDESID